MKCPCCGAETKGKFCEYCGNNMLEQTNINNSIGKCPKCGGSKIVYEREKVGTARQYQSRKNTIGIGTQGKSTSQSTYRTIGVCQNCGYTWTPNATESASNKKTWLWVLGWIFIFPVPLTILLLRKQDMKPAIKYGIIAVAWILYLIIGLSGSNETNNATTNNPSYNQETGITSNGTINETISLDTVLNNYIDNIVTNYNLETSEQLEFVENFTPSDRDSGHYRTEFRLNAYKDAVGKSYKLGGKVVDIIASQTYLGEINCRLYTNDTTLEQVITLINVFSPILDKKLTAIELQKTINEVSTKKHVNGYYFGDLGITLFGSDDSGYELLLKKD